VKLTWERRHLHLHHPFNIASLPRSISTDKEVLLISIEHEGHVGWGEAAPASYYGQTLESVEEVLAESRSMLGSDPVAIDMVLDRLEERFGDQSAALAAVDGALHDLAGKLLGKPVWQWLGLDSSNLPLSSMTIGIDDLESIGQKVREAAAYPILKVKLGTEVDEEILVMVRREAPDKLLRVDANGAWSSGEVLEHCRRLARFNLELIEQPTSPGDNEALPALRSEGIGPLMADESCVGIDDVEKCVGLFDGITIKLSKCGGIRRGLEMIRMARRLGLSVMLGCMVETSVGIGSAAQLASLADYVDLDGHLLLADDPFEGIGGYEGKLTLTDRPGLGVVKR
jgi:L-alanine-DL-glutamate epimerase-like enolase superfamily enzyme